MNPFYVEVLDYNPDRKYDFQDFVSFATLDKQYEPKKEMSRRAIPKTYESAWEAVNSINVIDALGMRGNYSLRGSTAIDV
jgi:hypothetical protein